MIYLWLFYDLFMIFGISFIFSLIFRRNFWKSLIFHWFSSSFFEILDFLLIFIYFFQIFLGIFLEIIKTSYINHKKIIKFMIYLCFLMIYLWFFMICLWFLGFPLFFHWFSKGISGNLWFFIDFPRVFLEILDLLNDLNLFFWIFLRNFMEFPWTHKKIIKFMIYLWFIYDLFMIYLWFFMINLLFLGFPSFFIDFPRVFLEILDFLNDLNLFFEFSLGISWNFLEIIKISYINY